MTHESLGDLWPRAEPILDGALALSEGDRAAYVDAVCQHDQVLHAAVMRLLHFADAPAGEADSGAAEWAGPVLARLADADHRSAVGERVGPYQLLRVLGQGGMGTVYVAERADDQYRKAVALKLVRSGLRDDPHLRERFLEERQILASLEHPNIARLLEGGVTADGEPWFAMEFVDGEALDHWCETRQCTREQRLHLFLAVCDAVQYAHRNLVIHRDLKPSNILVTADGVVKLLDFGIAKLLDPTRVSDRATQTGNVRPLTPEYASPEQMLGRAVATGADIYSLGVVLYELLTDVRPLSLTDEASSDWARIVSERTPIAPSLAAKDPRGLRGDLDTIVLMALRKEPERRYATVAQLAEDVRRHLAGRPVTARPDTWRYRTEKFVRRNRAAVTAGAVVLATILGGSAVIAARGREATRQARRADQAKNFLVDIFDAADPAGGNASDLTARQLLDIGTSRVDSSLAADPALRAEMLEILGEIRTDRGEYPAADSLLGRSVALTRTLHPATPASLAVRLTRWAWAIVYRNDYPRADSILTQSLAVSRAAGLEDTTYYETLNELAAVRRRTGKLADAERLYRQVLAHQVAVHGPDDPHVADQLNDLAVVLVSGRRFVEAESAYVASYRIRQRVLGPEALRTILSQGGVANARGQRGEFTTAIPMQRDVVSKLDRLYAEDRARRATHRVNLAEMLLNADSAQAALPFAREAFELRTALLGAAHRETLRAQLLVSDLDVRTGDLAGAARISRSALTTAEKAYGASDRTTAAARDAVGWAALKQGHAGAAETDLLTALAARRALTPAAARDVAESLRHLGVLYAQTARMEAATRMQTEVLALDSSEVPPDRSRIARDQALLETLQRNTSHP